MYLRSIIDRYLVNLVDLRKCVIPLFKTACFCEIFLKVFTIGDAAVEFLLLFFFAASLRISHLQFTASYFKRNLLFQFMFPGDVFICSFFVCIEEIDAKVVYLAEKDKTCFYGNRVAVGNILIFQWGRPIVAGSFNSILLLISATT